jgi:hypothetical protein
LLAAPPRLPALGLLALYVGLLAAAQRAVGRRRLRGERARPWAAAGLLILPVALAASSLLVYRGWVEKPGALLLEVATIRGDGGSPALRTEDVVVTAARPVKIRLRSSAALVIGSDGKDLTVGDGGEVGPLAMRAWESRSFYLQSLGPAPATVVRESDGSVLVRSGDRPLEDALLLDASGAYRLGSLGAGESRRIELGSGALPLSEAEPADDLRRVVLDSLAAEPGPHLRLVGWIEGPVHRVQVSIGLAKVRRVSCVVVETGG